MSRNWKFVRLKLQKFGVLSVVLLCQCLVCWSLNDEGVALLRFRERVVSDPFGALWNWKEKDGELDPCSWFGVECSEGRVVALNLKGLCLEGTVAPEIGTLIHIKSIILRNNCFGGTIPDGIATLKELEVLDLGYNNFSGSPPPDLGSNLSLTILLIDNNNELLGSLSPEIYKLQKLSEVQVDENQLSGAAELSCLKRLTTWDVATVEDAVHRRLLQQKGQSLSMPSASSPEYRFFYPNTSNQSLPLAHPTHSKSNETRLRNNGNNTSPSLNPPSNADPSPSPSPSTSPSLIPSTRKTLAKGPGSNNRKVAILAGTIGGSFLLILIVGIYLFKSNKVSTVKPWATGLSGQLQKAFVTGVPKLKRSELEAACEDFSNVIGSSPIGTVYKGTLSSGIEIAVASVTVKSTKDWSKNLEAQFRKKVDTLAKVNHKNFVNLLGFCEEDEPFTRMMVFEYAPNGTLFEHLHIKESEHLDWGMRLRIAVGMAYCLEHMHQLNQPVVHNNLNSSAVYLTEDYAAKVSDFSFGNETVMAEKEGGKNSPDNPLASLENNVYSFGILLFEMMTGRMPYMVDNGSLEDSASDYLRVQEPLIGMVDPTLNSYDEEKLKEIGDIIKSCVHLDPRQRPTMGEITARLREITSLSPDGAIPKLSPLWWAELEIVSTEAM